MRAGATQAEYIFEAKKMLARQFFYDHFTPEDICGMFTPGHFLSILLFFGTLGLALWRIYTDGKFGGLLFQ